MTPSMNLADYPFLHKHGDYVHLHEQFCRLHEIRDHLRELAKINEELINSEKVHAEKTQGVWRGWGKNDPAYQSTQITRRTDFPSAVFQSWCEGKPVYYRQLWDMGWVQYPNECDVRLAFEAFITVGVQWCVTPSHES